MEVRYADVYDQRGDEALDLVETLRFCDEIQVMAGHISVRAKHLESRGSCGLHLFLVEALQGSPVPSRTVLRLMRVVDDK